MEKEFNFTSEQHLKNFFSKYDESFFSAYELQLYAFFSLSISNKTYERVLSRLALIILTGKQNNELNLIIRYMQCVYNYGKPNDELKIEISKLFKKKKDYSNLKGKCGVYALYDEWMDNIIYIGRSDNLHYRIPQSVETHKAYAYQYWITRTSADAYVLEAYLINVHKPEFNQNSKANDDLTMVLEGKVKFKSKVIIAKGSK
ncbi:MAG: hypothetical protein OMM_03703 [Candidatus Magnetoglobus multicellularis str. Araruama]|uniref:GIY-YIG domain-containing protein n=1 Tax=Candidatus Magnetoglobus multicellularis str. Araruama TaxID=890399 RepID=A0A1V1P4Q1_9BACT|nr:MAG: hypothetical protein OMM_03703 [Candidatus Magnetoglobus multicellularis str. Araruama]